MSASYNSNKGLQDDFQSGCSICKRIDVNEYYGEPKGGASKRVMKKRAPSKKRGGADKLFEDFDKAMNMSLTYATQTGGTELASEYYTSAQQGSYAPYNASKDEKCGGGRKKRVERGGGRMDSYESQMSGTLGTNQQTTSRAKAATAGGGCGCGYKPKTSGTKRGGSDGYYADTLTGDDAVVEKLSTLNGQLDGGAKKRSSSKGAKKPKSSPSKRKPSRKHKGGDDSAGGGSDFATTLASWGPVNTTSVTDKAYFPIFNKSTPYISKQDLIKYAAPVLSGNCPDPFAYPRAYNDDFIGGTKKRKPTKKSTSSSKTKAKPAKKTTSSKAKKPTKKSSSSSKTKAKKH